MKIEMTGYATMRADVRSVEDLRQLVSALDKNKVRGDAEVDWGSGYVYVGVAEDARATWIECGDHLWGDEHWDVLIETHKHPEYENDKDDDEPIICAECGISHEHEDFGVAATAKFNSATGDYDFLCEPCAAMEPAKYDWPAKDRLNRYGDESRPE